MAGNRSSSQHKKHGKGMQTSSINTRSRAAAGFNVLEGLDENFPTLIAGNSGTKLSGKTAAVQVVAIAGETTPIQGEATEACDSANINGKPPPAGNSNATPKVLIAVTKAPVAAKTVMELGSPTAGTVPPAAGSETTVGKSTAIPVQTVIRTPSQATGE